MPIHIDILAEIDRRNINRQADVLADDAERAGKHAGDMWGEGFADGIEKNNPRITTALDKAAAATDKVTSAQMAYVRTAANTKSTDEQLFNSKLRVTNAMVAEEAAWTKVRGAVDETNATFNESRRIADDLAVKQEKLAKVISSSHDEAIKLNKAYVDTESSLRRMSDGMSKFESVAVTAERAMKESGEEIVTFGDRLANLGDAAFDASGSLGFGKFGEVLLAASPLLIVLAGQAVTAAQALWLLPAAGIAGGAAIGTLALATHGFDKAIKDIGDPKKFAKDIQSISPAAQQAALEIQHILPELKDLQQATQDDFFAGFAQKIDQLKNSFLPEIKGLTTNLAGTFNESITSVANELMTPQNEANINTMIKNIEDGFKNAAPAVHDVAQAIIDIGTAGSSFLPGLGSDIANAANEFANFIRQARESGQLQVWIQQGIDALKTLGSELYVVGEIIADVFGGKNKKELDDFTTDLEAWRKILSGDLSPVWHDFANEVIVQLNGMHGGLDKVRDVIADIPKYLVEAGQGFVNFANLIIRALNTPLQLLNKFDGFLNRIASFAGMKPDMPTDMDLHIPLIHNDFTDALNDPNNAWQKPGWQQRQVPYPGEGGDPNPPGGTGDPVKDANAKYSGSPDPTDPSAPHTWKNPTTGKQMTLVPGLGWVDSDDPRAQGANMGTYGGPFDVPAAPATGSQKSQLDSIKAGLDPSSYAVDPYAAVTGLPAVGGVPGASGSLIPGQAGVHGQQMLEANEAVLRAAHNLEESKKDLLAKQKDSNSTQEDIQKAQWKLTEDGWALQKAQADMAEKARGTAKSTKDGMDSLSAALDPDFGLSKGLSGLADNLVRFLGDMLFAPEKAKLQATVDADPIKGGYGLLGIRGAQNEAAGLSPVLGRPMPPGTYGYGAGGDGVGAPGYGAGAGQGSYGGYGQYGSLPGPAGGGSSYPAVTAGAGGTLSPSQQQVASQIIAAGQALGKSPAEITAGLNVAKLESNYGANPLSRVQQNQSGTIVQGVFQQDLGYSGDHNDPYNAATQFFQRMGQRAQPGDSAGQEAVRVQVGQYGGGYVDAQGQQGTYAALAPGANSGFVMPGGAAVPGANPWIPHLGGVPEGGNNAGPGGQGPYLPQSPADDNGPTVTDYTAPLPGHGMSWVPGRGWVVSGVGATLGTRPADQPYGSGAQSQFNYAPPLGVPGAAPDATAGASAGGLPQGIGGSNSWKPSGAGTGATTIGGVAPTNVGSGAGGVGMTPGGTLDTALSIGSLGLDALAPGAGQAAQVGIKEGSRAIQYAGAATAIGVQGALDTFLPTGGSQLAQNSWLTRILGGLAGATPAIPGMAGGKSGQGGQGGDVQGPLTPQQAIAQHLGNGTGSPGQQNNIVINNHDSSADQTGKQVEYHVSAGYPPPAGTR